MDLLGPRAALVFRLEKIQRRRSRDADLPHLPRSRLLCRVGQVKCSPFGLLLGDWCKSLPRGFQHSPARENEKTSRKTGLFCYNLLAIDFLLFGTSTPKGCLLLLIPKLQFNYIFTKHDLFEHGAQYQVDFAGVAGFEPVGQVLCLV